MFTFYILYSKRIDKFYIGYTGDDLAIRIQKHNSNHKGFTGGIGDWSSVYSETYFNKKDAIASEREVKKWKSRKMILRLVATGPEHPGL